MTSPSIRTLAAGLVAAAAVVPAGAALAQPGPSGDQCFRTSDIADSKRVGSSEFSVRTKDSRYFQVKTRGACRGGGAEDPLVFNTGGSGNLICRPVDVSLSSGINPTVPCLVDSIRQVPEGEAKAARAGAF